MTVAATNSFDVGTGNGSAKTFPFSFRCQDASNITVLVNGVIQSAGFIATIDSDGTGGNVTFDTAPAIAAKVLIVSTPAFEMFTRFTDAGPFLGSVADDANDAAAIRDIFLKGETKRSIKAPVGEAFTVDLPDKAARAGKFLGFDGNGDPLVSASSTGADAALRTDLVADTGANNVKAKQTFTGAVGLTILAKAREVVSIYDAGVIGDGLTDETAAINKLHAAFNAGEIAGYTLPRPVVLKTSAPLTKITRGGFAINGPGDRVALFKPQGNFDCFSFGKADPTTGRIGDIELRGFGIDYGDVSAPTAGLALRLSRIERAKIDVDIRNAFQSLLVEGGADIEFLTAHYGAPGSWSAVAVGSYLIKLKAYAGTTEVPSEINFQGVDIKGADANLERAGIIECGDGVSIVGGHSGFAAKALWWLNPQANNQLSLQNVEWSGHYFDGNSVGDATGAAFEISGSTLPVVEQIKIKGGFIRGYNGQGVRNYDSAGANNVSQLRRLDIDTTFSDIGKEFVALKAAQRFAIRAALANGNTSNSSSLNAMVFDACAWGKMDLMFDPQKTGKTAFAAGMRFINSCHDIHYGSPVVDTSYGALTTNDGSSTNVGA